MDEHKKHELKAVFFLGRASARIDQIFSEIEDNPELEVVAINAKADLYNFTHWFLGLPPEAPITKDDL